MSFWCVLLAYEIWISGKTPYEMHKYIGVDRIWSHLLLINFRMATNCWHLLWNLHWLRAWECIQWYVWTLWIIQLFIRSKCSVNVVFEKIVIGHGIDLVLYPLEIIENENWTRTTTVRERELSENKIWSSNRVTSQDIWSQSQLRATYYT